MDAVTSSIDALCTNFLFRPRLPKPAGIEVRHVGQSCEGIEICAKNRLLQYARTPEAIDRVRRILALLRRRGFDVCICAVDAGIGQHGVSLFCLRAVAARKAIFKIVQSGCLDVLSPCD
jgi:acetolactate synthase regulatory subunit